jgi:hypothetical protein
MWGTLTLPGAHDVNTSHLEGHGRTASSTQPRFKHELSITDLQLDEKDLNTLYGYKTLDPHVEEVPEEP